MHLTDPLLNILKFHSSRRWSQFYHELFSALKCSDFAGMFPTQNAYQLTFVLPVKCHGDGWNKIVI